MRIAVDLQGAQGASKLRGIGRYSISITKAIAETSNENEVIVVLNGGAVGTIDSIRKQLEGVIPDCNIVMWHPPSKEGVSLEAWKAASRAIKESFFESIEPDVILVTSVFEDDEQIVVSLSDQNGKIPKAVIHYDLIPMMFDDYYLSSPEQKVRYLSKLEELKKADLFLAISESSQKEAVELLGLDSTEVINISSAADDIFNNNYYPNDGEIVANFGIDKDFLLYTGSMDCRKNIAGLIRAFGKTSDAVRNSVQLVIVCATTKEDRDYLMWIASTAGLSNENVHILGYVSDLQLLNLYKNCKLFVFPSWHEGFGLPILEAMSCGAAAICSNTSSMPEVIGYDNALFDPFSDEDIAKKIEYYVSNPSALEELKNHCTKKSSEFSWAITGAKACSALGDLVRKKKPCTSYTRRKRLAFVSPMPPQKSGISDYSLELLPELSKHYDITVVLDDEFFAQNEHRYYTAVSAEYFKNNKGLFDRVLYHFGNSTLHAHMFELIEKIPGVVVLHDMYLSHILANLDYRNILPGLWANSLYESHGLNAVIERFTRSDVEGLLWDLPCSLGVLKHALGVIVHSESSRKLADKYYGNSVGSQIDVIPLLKSPPQRNIKEKARIELGIDTNSFVVCSFGFIGETKLNDRLIEAWIKSDFASANKCKLVFVGDIPSSEYGISIKKMVRENSDRFDIEITGWIDEDVYKKWLQAADVGVQLRTRSRGETSAAVLDCMNYGLATIVNANGSMAELPSTTVKMLDDDFTVESLKQSLFQLFEDEIQRNLLSLNARNYVQTIHQPRKCASSYNSVIEKSYRSREYTQNVVNSINQFKNEIGRDYICELAHAINVTFPNRFRRKRIFLDVSALVLHDLKTGIQRVVRAIINNVIKECPAGFHVELVYANTESQGYFYAHNFFARTFNVPNIFGTDSAIHYQKGDIFVGLDLHQHVVIAQSEYLQKMRYAGVKVKFVVYDLLPVLQPHVFPIQSDDIHFAWLDTIKNFDGALCISRAVADELYEFVRAYGSESTNKFEIDFFHLGADLGSSVPSLGIPRDSVDVLSTLEQRTSFLMVGTIEPRKAYLQVLKAFEFLWESDYDFNLIIVGQVGWKGLAEEYCRDIPLTVESIKNNPENGRRLIFLEGISDEFLDQVYKASDCLIAASYGEGFGLPLIEAAQHGIPIIARDIPVFREVAGEHAFYFDDKLDHEVISKAVIEWSKLYSEKINPISHGMNWLTWSACSKEFLKLLTNQVGNYRTWRPDNVIRFLGNDRRLKSQVGQRVLTNISTSGVEGFLLFGPYKRLSSGTYQIVIHGNLEALDGTEWFDIACDAGALRLLHKNFQQLQSGIILSGSFILDHPVDDFELRVYVKTATVMTISLLELWPFNSAVNPVSGYEPRKVISILPEVEQDKELHSPDVNSEVKNFEQSNAAPVSRHQTNSRQNQARKKRRR
jgi:glycosyltransferase involved in cell wall biosynthesis